ncbi:nuclear transport factor 2 family protein [Streptomyces sp. NPDC102274]|uniref:nuclear transport factor 2 family protein n=1 Tax=Streptomyces sp. NPDC102274 TaxID=3366151 RepID=UPI00382F8E41
MHDLERLVVIEDLRRLMARYVYLADHQRWTDMAGLFTTDGTFTPRLVDGSTVASCAAVNRSPTPRPAAWAPARP